MLAMRAQEYMFSKERSRNVFIRFVKLSVKQCFTFIRYREKNSLLIEVYEKQQHDPWKCMNINWTYRDGIFIGWTMSSNDLITTGITVYFGRASLSTTNKQTNNKKTISPSKPKISRRTNKLSFRYRRYLFRFGNKAHIYMLNVMQISSAYCLYIFMDIPFCTYTRQNISGSASDLALCHS